MNEPVERMEVLPGEAEVATPLTFEQLAAELRRWMSAATKAAWEGLSPVDILADLKTARVVLNRAERRTLRFRPKSDVARKIAQS